MEPSFGELNTNPTKLKPISHYETKNFHTWSKHYQINQRLYGNRDMDDIFKVEFSKAHKVSHFKIWRKIDQYIVGVQFKYTTQQNCIITGHLMKEEIPDNQCVVLESDLDQDEYIVEIFGRKGLHIDKLGFRTTKDREFVIGGEGGGPFSIKCPANFHFATFAANYGGNINALFVDIQEIPPMAPRNTPVPEVNLNPFVL